MHDLALLFRSLTTSATPIFALSEHYFRNRRYRAGTTRVAVNRRQY